MEAYFKLTTSMYDFVNMQTSQTLKELLAVVREKTFYVKFRPDLRDLCLCFYLRHLDLVRFIWRRGQSVRFETTDAQSSSH